MLLIFRSLFERFQGSVGAAQSSQTESISARERFIGTIAASQAAQSSSETAREDFRGNIVTLQSGQSSALVGRERFIGSLAASQSAQSDASTATERFIAAFAAAQATQSASVVSVERFIAAVSATQSKQTTAITANAGSTARTATIVTAQGAQTTDIEAKGPSVVDAPATPAQGWIGRARISGRASGKRLVVVPNDGIAVIATAQKRQTTRLTASENDDDLAYLYLELAA